MPIKFDMTDPETAETVGSWEDGQSYSIKMVDTEAGIGEFEEEPEPAGEAASEAAPSAPGPAAVKAAMGG